MNAKTFDKTMLPSRDVTEGPLRAARRSHLSRQTFATLVSGGRFSRATGESLIGRDSRETGVGDAIGLIQDGDILSIEAVKRTLDGDVSGVGESVARMKAWKAPAKTCGALHNDASQWNWARKSAVFHAGGKAEVVCYADI